MMIDLSFHLNTLNYHHWGIITVWSHHVYVYSDDIHNSIEHLIFILAYLNRIFQDGKCDIFTSLAEGNLIFYE